MIVMSLNKNIRMVQLVCAILIFFYCSGCSPNDDCIGVLNEDCFYPMVVDPVCGCDGTTYMNSGEALCYGIEEYENGACN